MAAVLVFREIHADWIESFGELVVQQGGSLVAQVHRKGFWKVGCDDHILRHVLQPDRYIDLNFVFTVEGLHEPEGGGDEEEKEKNEELPAALAEQEVFHSPQYDFIFLTHQ